MRTMLVWGLVLIGGLLHSGDTPGYAPGARVLVDAHNAYPSDGKFTDRIDRALSTGVPLAIEQDSCGTRTRPPAWLDRSSRTAVRMRPSSRPSRSTSS